MAVFPLEKRVLALSNPLLMDVWKEEEIFRGLLRLGSFAQKGVMVRIIYKPAEK